MIRKATVLGLTLWASLASAASHAEWSRETVGGAEASARVAKSRQAGNQSGEKPQVQIVYACLKTHNEKPAEAVTVYLEGGPAQTGTSTGVIGVWWDSLKTNADRFQVTNHGGQELLIAPEQNDRVKQMLKSANTAYLSLPVHPPGIWKVDLKGSARQIRWAETNCRPDTAAGCEEAFKYFQVRIANLDKEMERSTQKANRALRRGDVSGGLAAMEEGCRKSAKYLDTMRSGPATVGEQCWAEMDAATAGKASRERQEAICVHERIKAKCQ